VRFRSPPPIPSIIYAQSTTSSKFSLWGLLWGVFDGLRWCSSNACPSGDFTAEEFLGRTLTTCRGAGGCVSAFKGSTLTLGKMADACVYVGGGADIDTKAKGKNRKS